MVNILSLLSSDFGIVNAKMGLLYDATSYKYCLILDVEGFSTLGHFKLLLNACGYWDLESQSGIQVFVL